MRSPDLVRAISRRAQLPADQTKPMLEIFLDTIKDALRDKRRVELRGFGAFSVRDKEPAYRRNPKTGERIHVSQRQKLVFKPSQLFIGHLNDKHNSR